MGTIGPNDNNYLFKAKLLQGHEAVNEANDKSKNISLTPSVSSRNPIKDKNTNNNLRPTGKANDLERRNSLFALEQEFFFQEDKDDDDKWIEKDKDTLYGEW